MSRTVLIPAVLAAMMAAPWARAQDKGKPQVHESLPASPVTFAIDAPDPKGPWVLRLTNHGEETARIQADARLLVLLVAPAGKKYKECTLPAPLRAAGDRPLELQAGSVWEEPFDPRLWCFGKLVDEIGAGTSVTGFWGYKPDARRARARKPQLAPFAVEPALAPPAFASEKRLVSLTTWIPAASTTAPADATLAASRPEPINTSRIVLDPVRFVDAPAIGDMRVTATVKNVGDRSALIHLRPDQLEFRVTTPGGGAAICAARTRYRAPVRDFFRSLAPKASETLTVLLAEACPRDLFKRPGVYEVATVLRANADGKDFGLSAVTGDFDGEHTTLVRLQDGKASYYETRPRVQQPPKR